MKIIMKQERNLFENLKKRARREHKPSMRRRLLLALGSIAAILLLSSIISIVEYMRMSNYVSEKIATNINCLNQSEKLASMASELNLGMLSAVMSNDMTKLKKLDTSSFTIQCDTLRHSLASDKAIPATDSLMESFRSFLSASLALEKVFESDSLDTSTWFFEQLQPRYVQVRKDINSLNSIIHDQMRANSEGFDESFYRGIMPGLVAVGAGLVLVFLLMYFILSLYVNPLFRISNALDNFLSTGKRYAVTFEGDDQIANINNAVTEITEENLELKRRISVLKHSAQAADKKEEK